MTPGETAVRDAFLAQERGCLKLGSPFTARLCAAFEADPGCRGGASLRLSLWPDGSEHVLAAADPHARAVAWEG